MWSKTRHQLGLDCPGTLKYYLFLILLAIVLLLFAVRFELVRAFPVAGKIYDALGIEARVVGEGLEFQNVIRDEYTEDYVRILEIRGYIANTTPQAMDIPLIHVEILDKDTNLLQALNDKAPITRIEADGRIAFRIAIKQPSTLTKYILLTFTKN